MKNIEDRIAITFVPSKGLDKIFNKYKSIIYYCVHDSENQAYNIRNKNFEKELIEKAKLVFCDNKDVLNRFCSINGDNFYDLSSYSLLDLEKLNEKFFIFLRQFKRVL
ncbi:hypothetical protein [Photobacterium damselae]|uniref:hypothetical protein n=1 Tax=Photobacterium damselae TaxID=38293 RepID=UPI001F388796|nr:hypothetical protein [Photobacterium damselae]UKA29915.1 hypothetical protein IPQ37_04275 [Photobacterium damselae subsp. damselae]